ncbi:MAG: hypothetical protein Q9227_008310 [Pyrenula ochraceoflavens]
MSLRRNNSSSLISQTKQHLLAESPLPSPSLPSIVPRHGKKSKAHSLTRKIIRLLVWLIGVTILLWGTDRLLRSSGRAPAISYLSSDGGSYEIVGEEDLPDTPTPVMVTDRRGRSKWTISIPPALDFPLKPAAYAGICSMSDEIAQHVRETKSNAVSTHSHSGHYGYYRVDPNYMDIGDAEEHGLLPGFSSRSSSLGPANEQSMLGSLSSEDSSLPICDRSLTFLLATPSAGLGPTLLSLWLAYGLAQREHRAFFLDSTGWPYGSYTTYFLAPPTPKCRPPPKTQRTSCPHYAKHLVISAATTKWAFGHAFTDEFEDPKKIGVARQRPIFDLIRTGYEALFKLQGEDASFLETRIAELNDTIRGKGGIEVGVHVRHGDRHPYEFQYQKSYIPLAKYVEAARDLIFDEFEGPKGTNRKKQESAENKEFASRLIVASDDPEVYESEEMKKGGIRAQGRISLASKTHLDEVKDGKSKSKSKGMKKPGHLGETLGWEGGFFTPVFWSLGLGPRIPKVEGAPTPSRRRDVGPEAHYLTPRSDSSSTSASSSLEDREAEGEEDAHAHPSPESLQLRELVGRSYLLDLGVLGQADRIVCGVSASGCRILAVMMGWEKAMERGWWKNVDGEFDWKGVVW